MGGHGPAGDTAAESAEDHRQCVDAKSQVRPWNAPSECCRWAWVTWKVSPTTTVGTSATTLLAALNVLDGSVITLWRPRHRKFLSFLNHLNHLDRNIPAALAVHLIADNHATQTSTHQSLADAPSARSPSLHAGLCQLAQPGRALVRAGDATGGPARLVPQRARIGATDRPICHAPQPSPPPVRLDCYR